MMRIDANQPSKVLRGRWEEILTHSDEIPKTSEVELKIFEPKRRTATMELMQSWLEEDATDDPNEIRAAEEDLREFQNGMNVPRKEAAARLLFPESE